MDTCLLLLRLFQFVSTKPTDWLGRTSSKWPIMCRVGRKTLTQSVQQTTYRWGHSIQINVTNFNIGAGTICAIRRDDVLWYRVSVRDAAQATVEMTPGTPWLTELSGQRQSDARRGHRWRRVHRKLEICSSKTKTNFLPANGPTTVVLIISTNGQRCWQKAAIPYCYFTAANGFVWRWPTWVPPPNGISVGSAVLQGSPCAQHRQTDIQTTLRATSVATSRIYAIHEMRPKIRCVALALSEYLDIFTSKCDTNTRLPSSKVSFTGFSEWCYEAAVSIDSRKSGSAVGALHATSSNKSCVLRNQTPVVVDLLR